ncbi:MAG: transporter [Opitutales bacterium]
MKIHTTTLLLIASACMAEIPKPAFPCCPAEEGEHHSRPDAHASISVMGDHTHAKGGLMLAYRYMHMHMDGMRSGTDRVSSSEVFAADGGYTVTPENMSMEMHMFGLMYAPTNTLTLMLMANYLETEMDHRLVTQMAANRINGGATGFTTESFGWGDTKLSALYRFYLEENRKAHFGLGISIPTGSIDERDALPSMMGPTQQQMPAPMQLGSGTYDLLPSLTFVQQFEDWSWGAQANGIIRLEDENSNGYRHGHAFEAVSWAGYKLADWIGINGGLSYKNTGKLKGTQNDVNRLGPNGRSVTTAFNHNYGGERIDVILGVNLLGTSGRREGHRIAADVRAPLWQDLNGYQLETDWVLTLGWQKSF